MSICGNLKSDNIDKNGKDFLQKSKIGYISGVGEKVCEKMKLNTE